MPEALLGGPIALVKDGDKITIDSATREIIWHVDEEEQARRRVEWEASGKHEYREKRGILYKYARDVAVSRRWPWGAVGAKLMSPYDYSLPMLVRTLIEEGNEAKRRGSRPCMFTAATLPDSAVYITYVISTWLDESDPFRMPFD